MARLFGFDYKRPFFYMVTLKKVRGVKAFSEIGPEGLVKSELTRRFEAVIRAFHKRWFVVAPITTFVVMPDHLHLLIKIEDVPERLHLGKIVYQLMKALSAAYGEVEAGAADGAAGRKTFALERAKRGGVSCAEGAASLAKTSSVSSKPAPIFEPEWHDWIVKKRGQLAAFARYIRENPERAWLRKVNAQYFGKVRTVEFLERKWFAYGNTAILDLPVLVAVKGHRTTKPESAEWKALAAGCSRIGPGGAGVGTFMSPLEKVCGNAIYAAGGSLIVLSPEGFGERWHPPREKERLCATGRMLFLSLYEAAARQPTRAELYERCHAMGDIVVAGLPGADAPEGKTPNAGVLRSPRLRERAGGLE